MDVAPIPAPTQTIFAVASRKLGREGRSEFTLDADVVALPEAKRPGPIYFPLDVLEVGRSFTTKRGVWTVKSAIRRYLSASGSERKFASRPLPEGGCRVWRVK